jgi:hypothetical protein
MQMYTLVFKLIRSVKTSKTLMSFHISENEFTSEIRYVIDKMMGVPLCQATKLQ